MEIQTKPKRSALSFFFFSLAEKVQMLENKDKGYWLPLAGEYFITDTFLNQ